MKAKVVVEVPFEKGPAWLACIQFTRDGDKILIEIVKESGILQAETFLSTTDFNQMADTLLANPQ